MCNGFGATRRKLVTRLIFAWCKTGLRTRSYYRRRRRALFKRASLFRHSLSSRVSYPPSFLSSSSLSFVCAAHVIVSLARHVVHIKNRALSGNNFSASSIFPRSFREVGILSALIYAPVLSRPFKWQVW